MTTHSNQTSKAPVYLAHTVRKVGEESAVCRMGENGK